MQQHGSPPSPETGESLVGGLVALVRDRVVRGEIAPGAKLNEHAMAASLGVSRTALREAVRVLERSNLLVIEPNRGVFVRRITLKQAMDLFDVRAGLARTAGLLAAVRASEAQLDAMRTLHARMVAARAVEDAAVYYDANTQFHATLMAATGNERLMLLEDMMGAELQLFRRRNLGNAGHLDASGAEHGRILDAMVARDPMRAARAAERHIAMGKQRMLDTMAPDA